MLGVRDYSGYDDAVSDAQINISDGVQTVTLKFNPSERAYFYDLKDMPGFIKAGGKYSLSASTPNGQNVSAVTTVPTNTVDSATAKIIFTGKVEKNMRGQTLEFEFFDIPAEENFYRIEAYVKSWEIFGERPGTPIYFIKGESQFSLNLFLDQNKDGKLIKSGEGTYYRMEDYQRAIVNVYNTSKEYYEYHRSIGNFQGDSPFAEPVLVYTNIENGLGVFAGYTVTVVSAPLPE